MQPAFRVLCFVWLIALCEACSREFVRYYPSPFEADWVANINSYQDNICEVILAQKPKFMRWLTMTDALDVEMAAGVRCGKARQEIEGDHGIFSRMEYRYTCSVPSNPLHGRLRNESIEPIVGLVRDPRAMCNLTPFKLVTSKSDLSDRQYIVYSDYNCLDPHNLGHSPRLIIQDMGSTTYLYSLSGPSQSYFVERYRNLSYGNLHRLQAWEARPYPKVHGVFDQVPADVIPHYQFFNVPITSIPGDKFNPLTLLKAVARPRDFVAVKLDVDHSDIEFAIIEQILTDEKITSLVDEFFFEHHSTVKFMEWAWRQQARGDVATGYKFFGLMRQKGIRAHSWI